MTSSSAPELSWNVLNAAVLFPAQAIIEHSGIQSCAKPYPSAETLTVGQQWTNNAVMVWNMEAVILFEVYLKIFMNTYILCVLMKGEYVVVFRTFKQGVFLQFRNLFCAANIMSK